MNKQAKIRKLEPNGTLPLKLGFRGAFFDIRIIGGPFDAYRPGDNADVGFCVRAERVPPTADYVLLIEDFSVPLALDLHRVNFTLARIMEHAMSGERVFVGCQGGWGRTGLVLALLAKVAGVEDPVAYVRAHYTPYAVETEDQRAYVAEFDERPVQAELYRTAWRKRWTTWLPWTAFFFG